MVQTTSYPVVSRFVGSAALDNIVHLDHRVDRAVQPGVGNGGKTGDPFDFDSPAGRLVPSAVGGVGRSRDGMGGRVHRPAQELPDIVGDLDRERVAARRGGVTGRSSLYWRKGNDMTAVMIVIVSVHTVLLAGAEHSRRRGERRPRRPRYPRRHSDSRRRLLRSAVRGRHRRRRVACNTHHRAGPRRREGPARRLYASTDQGHTWTGLVDIEPSSGPGGILGGSPDHAWRPRVRLLHLQRRRRRTTGRQAESAPTRSASTSTSTPTTAAAHGRPSATGCPCV